jgi:hypothetical protein
MVLGWRARDMSDACPELQLDAAKTTASKSLHYTAVLCSSPSRSSESQTLRRAEGLRPSR